MTGLEIIIIIGFLFILAELVIGIETGFDLVVIGATLVLSGFVGRSFDSFFVTVLLILVLTTIYIVFGRSMLKAKFKAFHKKTNIDKIVDHTGIILSATSFHEAGKVKIDGEEWRAISHKRLTKGTEVTVSAVEGVTLLVEKK